jgi:hypothetical protein
MRHSGEFFLHQRDTSLHTSQPVEHEQQRKKTAGERVSKRSEDKIADWLAVVEKTHTSHRDDPAVAERIKASYRREYVIKPEDIPDSYYDTQRRIAREQGHGDIEITDEQKKQLGEVVVNDQQASMDMWVDYFTSPDSDSYPVWAKYWAFTGMVKLSAYDKETHSFNRRTKGTTTPFPDLNREALAYVVDAIIKKADNEHTALTQDNPEFKKLLDSANFGKLYAHAIEKVTPAEEKELADTTGEWVKYPKGSDHMPLVESLQGHGTGWCTAGESTARTQLDGGDFYVYYSNNKQGKPAIPRAAIRMQGNAIAEVRGVGANQNLDPYIGDVVDTKLDEFPDKEQYKKKSADMKRVTEIDNRVSAGGALTKGDLRFLYEVDTFIDGFGHEKDPRIAQLLKNRDIKSDLSLATGYAKEQISITEDEALSGNSKFHYGGLILPLLESAEGLTFPQTINGRLNLLSLKSAEGLTFPQTVNGDLFLSRLTSAEGLTLPQTIEGGLDLQNLTSAEGLTLPQTLNGSLDLRSLKSAEGLTLPQTLNGSLDLGSLPSAKGLVFPQTIGRNLNLRSLKSAEGLVLPQTIGRNLDLGFLPSAEKEKLQKAYPEVSIL